MTRRWLSALAMSAVTFSAVACSSAGDEHSSESTTGPLMRPGDNCLRCHQTSSGLGAPEWTAAGTVFGAHDAPPHAGVQAATLHITDAAGHSVTLVSNEAGNFYTPDPLTPPLHVVLEAEGEQIEMPVPAPAGSCNACHSKSPVGGPRGRIFVPGSASNQSQAICDGDHTISFPSSSSYDCSPYRCVDTPRPSCLFECTDSTACAGEARCEQGRCVEE